MKWVLVSVLCWQLLAAAPRTSQASQVHLRGSSGCRPNLTWAWQRTNEAVEDGAFAEVALAEALRSTADAAKLQIADVALKRFMNSVSRVEGNSTGLRAALQTLDGASGDEKQSQLARLSMRARRAESLALSDLLEAAAKDERNDNAQEFIRQLKICGDCKEFVRVGEPFDGGYVMCHDGLDRTLKGAYSFGIAGYDGYGMDVATLYGVPVFEYDCYDDRRPVPCSGCEVSFKEKCIQGNSEHKGWQFQSLTEMMTVNEQFYPSSSNSSLLMKLDVEGAEYSIWAQETLQTLSKFRHINTEFHSLQQKAYHPSAKEGMSKLLASGFAVAHLHGNNHEGMAYFGDYAVPNVLEVTLMRVPAGTPCANLPPREIPQDAPCSGPSSTELPPARLPP